MRDRAPHQRFGKHTKLTRSALTVLAVVSMAGTVALAASGPAQADTVLTQHVYNTGGEGLWLHPSDTALSGALSDLMPDGTEFDITCWTNGDDVNGDSVWDYGTNATTGNTGYAADYYLDTNTTQGSEGDQLTAQGVPQCGSGTPSPAPASSGQSGNDQTMDLSTPCQGSPWVEDLVVVPYPNGNFKIEVTPNPDLRNPIHAFDRDITVDIWHDIQSCVPGLYGGLADSVWQQLQCHQEGAALPSLHGGWATGDTFDFESWHPALPNPGLGTYESSHCLNNLGTDPGGPTGGGMRPGEGYLDLGPIA